MQDLASAPVGERLVVVVHGAMACGVPLADAIAPRLTARRTIARFEHDTWLDVHINAYELASLIAKFHLREASFVAHGRGGLVVQQALQQLSRTSSVPDGQVLTLGTPFAGSEVLELARTGWDLGTTAAKRLPTAGFGMLEQLAIPGTGLAAKLISHLIGKGMPPGIAAMSPRSAHTAWSKYVTVPGLIAVAGIAKVDDIGAHRTFGRVALASLAGAVLAGQDHDLVVPAESAHAAAGPDGVRVIVRCDHSDYLADSNVRRLLGTL